MTEDCGDPCSVREISSLLSKKWRLNLLRAVQTDGPCRFSDLKRRFDISSKVLTNSLNELTDYGIVERTAHSGVHVTYSLTDSGADLLDTVGDLDSWTARSGRKTVPTVLVVDDNPRLNNLFADLLHSDYDVRQACERRQLERQQFEVTDVVVFHYKPRGPIDHSALQSVAKPECDCRLVVVVPTRRHLERLELHHCGHLVLPVTKPELRRCIEHVLDCRADDE
ncbi:transcriptional regulator, HxlR family [Halogranum rubrum]|uniref:Transcriptional regulator, HxlR family n=1 Tax=Halogranum rubrum TaxID=553466 RepID=A0A1I4EQ55_9EURY|nr:helix-turn-helix domain-containing protein [Halogranum rubrum]SFL07814.1 transcriptional regulator, HxlR family [Halogranum rubrum]